MAQKILVVDDSRTVCRIVQWVFHASPYEVFAVHSAADALAALEVEVPHALVVDYWLPDRGGVELVAEIRRHPAYARMPIVVLGGRNHPFDEGDVARAGAQGLIYKPFRTDDIIETIAQAVSSMANRPVQFTPDEPHRSLAISEDVVAISSGAHLAVDDDDDLGIELDNVRDVSAEFEAVGEPAPGEDDLFGDADRFPPAGDDAPVELAGSHDSAPAHAEPEESHDHDNASGGSGFRRLKPAGPPPVPATGRFKKVGAGPLAPAPPRSIAASSGSDDAPDDAPSTEPVQADAILSVSQAAVTTPAPVPPAEIAPAYTEDDDAFRDDDDASVEAQHVASEPAFAEPAAEDEAPETVPVTAAEPVAAEPQVAAAAAPVVLAATDAETLRAAVHEILPGLVREQLPAIVKEYLAIMLRQTGAKLEQYSNAKIEQFCERDLPRLAEEAIEKQLAELTGEG